MNLVPGSLVGGRYEIRRKLGEGGMGAVFLAYHRGRREEVALKILSRSVDSIYFELFEREVYLLSTLEHPNIVRIFDVGWHLSSPYFVMSYVEGVTLFALVGKLREERKILHPDRICEIFLQVGKALAHAHARNVFHRDMKPENILVGRDGCVYLLDFGLAKLLHDERIVPRNCILGTPHYMAPEQVLGGEVDHRSDIYSTGLIMYLCLAGRFPIMDPDPLKMAKRRTVEPLPPPSRFNRNVPRELERIVMRCLEREPSRRYQLADDFCLELERFLLARGTDGAEDGAATSALADGARRDAPGSAGSREDGPGEGARDETFCWIECGGIRRSGEFAVAADGFAGTLRSMMEASSVFGLPFSSSLEEIDIWGGRAELPDGLGGFSRSMDYRVFRVVVKEALVLWLVFEFRPMERKMLVRLLSRDTEKRPLEDGADPVALLERRVMDAGGVEWDGVVKDLENAVSETILQARIALRRRERGS